MKGRKAKGRQETQGSCASSREIIERFSRQGIVTSPDDCFVILQALWTEAI